MRRPNKDPKVVFEDIFMGSIVEEVHMNTMREFLGLVEYEWIQNFPRLPTKWFPQPKSNYRKWRH